MQNLNLSNLNVAIAEPLMEAAMDARRVGHDNVLLTPELAAALRVPGDWDGEWVSASEALAVLRGEEVAVTISPFKEVWPLK